MFLSFLLLLIIISNFPLTLLTNKFALNLIPLKLNNYTQINCEQKESTLII